ncbi:MAG: putative beta-D-galactosidase [Clostridia bacterium]|nr:putative beta-D-galactosidase [Clostridia bacterium]
MIQALRLAKEQEVSMIVDKIQHIEKYKEWDIPVHKIMEFIAYQEKVNLPDGRYDILGDNLFALVQIYKTRDYEEGKWEAHREYSDLQYMVEGAEWMYWALPEKLTVSEGYNPQKDILFYQEAPYQGSMLLEQGMFALFLPQDIHRPCCKVQKEEAVKKIVFKIKYKG